MPRVSPCSLRTKNSLCCFGKLSFLTVSQLYIAFRWRNVSVLMSMLSCLNAVLSTKFWPTAKQGINKRTINPIDFFGTIIQISIDLFLIRPDKPIAHKTLRHFALLAVDELVDVLDGFVQWAHFAIIDKEKYSCNYDEHHYWNHKPTGWDVCAVVNFKQKPDKPEKKKRNREESVKLLSTFVSPQSVLCVDYIVSCQILVTDCTDIPEIEECLENHCYTYGNDWQPRNTDYAFWDINN